MGTDTGPLEPLPINADTISIDGLSRRQRQCLLMIFAGALRASPEFGEPILADLAGYLDLPGADEMTSMAAPLLEHDIDISPFVDDLELPALSERARLVLILLHFSLVRFKAYDSRIRVAMFALTDALHVARTWLYNEESLYITLLLAEDTNPDATVKKRKQRLSKWLKVGAAAAVGTGLMVVTGGLAAPAIGAGISALGITSVGAFLGTTTGAAILTGLFGVGGGGLASYKMHRRVGDLSNFDFRPICNDGSIHVMITVSGILFGEHQSSLDVWGPLSATIEATCADAFTLEWQTEAQIDAGRCVSDFLTTQASGIVVQHALQETILGGVAAAVAAPAAVLSTGGYLIDNPWGVLISKADRAGDELGHVLLQRLHGGRPVVLVGFSAGARVIVRALEHLHANKGFGIVQDVYILGCPYWPSHGWSRVREIVAGRIVNAYSPDDWVMKVVYRAVTASFSVCALGPTNCPGIEDINVSHIVTNHGHYIKKLPEVLGAVGLGPASPTA
ncbi:Transmembrane and coiled-coil domain-containing protein 4 [Plasmodiophora brassicae]